MRGDADGFASGQKRARGAKSPRLVPALRCLSTWRQTWLSQRRPYLGTNAAGCGRQKGASRHACRTKGGRGEGIQRGEGRETEAVMIAMYKCRRPGRVTQNS